MGFLRRLFGDRSPSPDERDKLDPAEVEASEREHELEIARGEQERLDELQQRQPRAASAAPMTPAARQSRPRRT
jgi:hypothetical protein